MEIDFLLQVISGIFHLHGYVIGAQKFSKPRAVLPVLGPPASYRSLAFFASTHDTDSSSVTSLNFL